MNDPDYLNVAASAHGELATYACRAFAPGDVLYTIRGKSTGRRTRDSIEIAPGEHVEDDYALRINHSFDPNIEVRGRALIALRAIAVEDEVTFNYLANESEIAAPFTCHDTGRAVDSGGCRPVQGAE